MLLNPHRLRRLSGVALAQAAAQVVAFVCGIVLVRAMPPDQYGFYTLTMSMVGIGAVVGDLGLASGVLAQGGRSGVAVFRLLLERASRLRRRLAAIALPLAALGGAVLLGRQGAHGWTVALLCLVGALTAFWQVRAQVELQLLRLVGDVATQQRLDLGLNTMRLLGLLALAAVLGSIDAPTAAALALLAAIVYGLMLRRRLAQHRASWPVLAGANPSGIAIDAALGAQMLRQAPNALYFVFSGQVTMWLLAWFGSAQSVAELGALGRLAAAFALIDAVAASLVYPWFARQGSASAVRAGLRTVHAGFFGLIAALQLAAWVAPELLLWVLGPSYAGLRVELAWMLMSASLASWSGVLYSVGAARGWILPFGIAAPCGLAVTALAAAVVDPSTVKGGLGISTSVAAAGVLLAAGHLAWRLRWQEAARG